MLYFNPPLKLLEYFLLILRRYMENFEEKKAVYVTLEHSFICFKSFPVHLTITQSTWRILRKENCLCNT